MESNTNDQPLSLKELKQRIEAIQAKPLGRRRYGALKKQIIRYGQARRRQGATVKVIANELGLSRDVFASWLRTARPYSIDPEISDPWPRGTRTTARR